MELDFPKIIAVDLDQPLVIAVQHLQQPGNGGFARAASPHHAEYGALRGRERDAVERRPGRAAITKSHIVELETAVHGGAEPTLSTARPAAIVSQVVVTRNRTQHRS